MNTTTVHHKGVPIPLRMRKNGTTSTDEHTLWVILNSDEFKREFRVTRRRPNFVPYRDIDAPSHYPAYVNGQFLSDMHETVIREWLSRHFSQFAMRHVSRGLSRLSLENYEKQERFDVLMDGASPKVVHINRGTGRGHGGGS